MTPNPSSRPNPKVTLVDSTLDRVLDRLGSKELDTLIENSLLKDKKFTRRKLDEHEEPELFEPTSDLYKDNKEKLGFIADEDGNMHNSMEYGLDYYEDDNGHRIVVSKTAYDKDAGNWLSARPSIDDVFNHINESENIKNWADEHGDISIMIPIISNYRGIFGRKHTHFRMVSVKARVEDDKLVINSVNLIDSRNGFFGRFAPSKIIKNAAKKYFNKKIEKTYLGHQSVSKGDNDSCGYRVASEVVQTATGTKPTDLADKIQCSTKQMEFIKNRRLVYIFSRIFGKKSLEPTRQERPTINHTKLQNAIDDFKQKLSTKHSNALEEQLGYLKKDNETRDAWLSFAWAISRYDKKREDAEDIALKAIKISESLKQTPGHANDSSLKAIYSNAKRHKQTKIIKYLKENHKPLIRDMLIDEIRERIKDEDVAKELQENLTKQFKKALEHDDADAWLNFVIMSEDRKYPPFMIKKAIEIIGFTENSQWDIQTKIKYILVNALHKKQNKVIEYIKDNYEYLTGLKTTQIIELESSKLKEMYSAGNTARIFETLEIDTDIDTESDIAIRKVYALLEKEEDLPDGLIAEINKEEWIEAAKIALKEGLEDIAKELMKIIGSDSDIHQSSLKDLLNTTIENENIDMFDLVLCETTKDQLKSTIKPFITEDYDLSLEFLDISLAHAIAAENIKLALSIVDRAYSLYEIDHKPEMIKEKKETWDAVLIKASAMGMKESVGQFFSKFPSYIYIDRRQHIGSHSAIEYAALNKQKDVIRTLIEEGATIPEQDSLEEIGVDEDTIKFLEEKRGARKEKTMDVVRP